MEEGREGGVLTFEDHEIHVGAPPEADLEDIYSDDKCFQCKYFLTSTCTPYMDWRIEYDLSAPHSPIPSPIPESCEMFLYDDILEEV